MSFRHTTSAWPSVLLEIAGAHSNVFSQSPDGRVLGFNTDKEILAGIRADRACVIGAGGAARTLVCRCCHGLVLCAAWEAA